MPPSSAATRAAFDAQLAEFSRQALAEDTARAQAAIERGRAVLAHEIIKLIFGWPLGLVPAFFAIIALLLLFEHH